MGFVSALCHRRAHWFKCVFSSLNSGQAYVLGDGRVCSSVLTGWETWPANLLKQVPNTRKLLMGRRTFFSQELWLVSGISGRMRLVLSCPTFSKNIAKFPIKRKSTMFKLFNIWIPFMLMTFKSCKLTNTSRAPKWLNPHSPVYAYLQRQSPLFQTTLNGLICPSLPNSPSFLKNFTALEWTLVLFKSKKCTVKWFICTSLFYLYRISPCKCCLIKLNHNTQPSQMNIFLSKHHWWHSKPWLHAKH